MKFAFLLLLFIYGCNSEDGASKNKAKISPGEIDSSRVAKAFIQDSSKEIKPSHQIQNEELIDWVKEGLISESEAKEIQDTITVISSTVEL